MFEQTSDPRKLTLSSNFPQIAKAFGKEGSQHLLNKPLEVLRTTYGLDNLYLDLLASVGRQDHQSTLTVLFDISSKLDLGVADYEDALLDHRLNELYHEAQTQLSSWDSFVFVNQQ